MTTTTDLTHPKAQEAFQRAVKRVTERKDMKAQIEDAKKEGVRFVAAKPYMIAYTTDRRNLIAVATAICHPNDAWDPLAGKYLAAQRLLRGVFIDIRIPNNYIKRPGLWLHEMFSPNYPF